MNIKKPGETAKKKESVSITIPEKMERLPASIVNILNKQIQNEFNNAMMYLVSGMWLYKNNFTNGWRAYNKFSEEELSHMTKIVEYLKERNCEVKQPIDIIQKEDFKNVMELLRSTLQREFDTTRNWEDIAEVCKKVPCSTTYFFVGEFLNIQRAEEKKHREFVRQFELSSDQQAKDLDYVFSGISDKSIG